MLLIGIGVLSTYGPAPGSLEGLVYTRLRIVLGMLTALTILMSLAGVFLAPPV